jgi:hypothetical protein
LIVQLEEAKYKLLGLEEAVKELASAIKIDKLNAKIAELEEQTSAAGFWEMEGSGKILQELKRAKDKLEEYDNLKAQTEDALTLTEMGIEENDESVVEEVLAEVAAIEKGEEKTMSEYKAADIRFARKGNRQRSEEVSSEELRALELLEKKDRMEKDEKPTEEPGDASEQKEFHKKKHHNRHRRHHKPSGERKSNES